MSLATPKPDNTPVFSQVQKDAVAQGNYNGLNVHQLTYLGKRRGVPISRDPRPVKLEKLKDFDKRNDGPRAWDWEPATAPTTQTRKTKSATGMRVAAKDVPTTSANAVPQESPNMVSKSRKRKAEAASDEALKKPKGSNGGVSTKETPSPNSDTHKHSASELDSDLQHNNDNVSLIRSPPPLKVPPPAPSVASPLDLVHDHIERSLQTEEPKTIGSHDIPKMTHVQKTYISDTIAGFDEVYTVEAFAIIKAGYSEAATQGDEMELDIDELPSSVLYELLELCRKLEQHSAGGAAAKEVSTMSSPDNSKPPEDELQSGMDVNDSSDENEQQKTRVTAAVDESDNASDPETIKTHDEERKNDASPSHDQEQSAVAVLQSDSTDWLQDNSDSGEGVMKAYLPPAARAVLFDYLSAVVSADPEITHAALSTKAWAFVTDPNWSNIADAEIDASRVTQLTGQASRVLLSVHHDLTIGSRIHDEDKRYAAGKITAQGMYGIKDIQHTMADGLFEDEASSEEDDGEGHRGQESDEEPPRRPIHGQKTLPGYTWPAEDRIIVPPVRPVSPLERGQWSEEGQRIGDEQDTHQDDEALHSNVKSSQSHFPPLGRG